MGEQVPFCGSPPLSAYVRSMSLPQTLPAQNGATASQSLAPVPREADQDHGWSMPDNTTHRWMSTTTGPQ